MFGRCADFAVQLSEAACAAIPLDWLWAGDDVASQRSLMMSPTTWRKMIKPHLARVFAVGKANKLWVAYHCCGALRPIIADLVEMGLDVLNPIQCNCPGMDPLELKREFGDKLSFMGGVDTQELLPNGTAAEVRRATRRLIDGMTATAAATFWPPRTHPAGNAPGEHIRHVRRGGAEPRGDFRSRRGGKGFRQSGGRLPAGA